MLRVGRCNERSLDGPMKLPGGVGEMLADVEKVYDAWFKIWNISYLPKLIQQPKWFKEDKHLNENDIVMFQKDNGFGQEMDIRFY